MIPDQVVDVRDALDEIYKRLDRCAIEAVVTVSITQSSCTITFVCMYGLSHRHSHVYVWKQEQNTRNHRHVVLLGLLSCPLPEHVGHIEPPEPESYLCTYVHIYRKSSCLYMC
jgi:hypothetical protein